MKAGKMTKMLPHLSYKSIEKSNSIIVRACRELQYYYSSLSRIFIINRGLHSQPKQFHSFCHSELVSESQPLSSLRAPAKQSQQFIFHSIVGRGNK